MKKLFVLLISIVALVGCGKKEDEVKWVRAPMFMYQDNLYYFERQYVDYDRTYVGDSPENIEYDGKFESTIDLTELPTKNGQSNFGIYEYVLMDDGSIEVYLGDRKWMVLSRRDN